LGGCPRHGVQDLVHLKRLGDEGYSQLLTKGGQRVIISTSFDAIRNPYAGQRQA
jgi:hypothetical protein